MLPLLPQIREELIWGAGGVIIYKGEPKYPEIICSKGMFVKQKFQKDYPRTDRGISA
jgi:hypothetical protein